MKVDPICYLHLQSHFKKFYYLKFKSFGLSCSPHSKWSQIYEIHGDLRYLVCQFLIQWLTSSVKTTQVSFLCYTLFWITLEIGILPFLDLIEVLLQGLSLHFNQYHSQLVSCVFLLIFFAIIDFESVHALLTLAQIFPTSSATNPIDFRIDSLNLSS